MRTAPPLTRPRPTRLRPARLRPTRLRPARLRPRAAFRTWAVRIGAHCKAPSVTASAARSRLTHEGPLMSEFEFDGRPVPFTDGQSIGAALVADGVRSWRTTRREGRP